MELTAELFNLCQVVGRSWIDNYNSFAVMIHEQLTIWFCYSIFYWWKIFLHPSTRKVKFVLILIIVPKTKIYIFEKLQRQSYSDDDPGYKPGLSAVVQVIGGGIDQNNTGCGAGVKSMSS